MPLLATAASAGWDELVFRALNLANSNAALDILMEAATTLGAAYIIALVAVPLWGSGRREATFDFLILLAVTVVLTEIIKFVVDRPRPCEALSNVQSIPGYGCDAELDPSFPSGHASRAFALAAFAALRFRWRAGSAATAFAVLVGVSRIYLGVHWPSDVVAGALLGVGLAFAMEIASRRLPPYRRIRAAILDPIPHWRRAA